METALLLCLLHNSLSLSVTFREIPSFSGSGVFWAASPCHWCGLLPFLWYERQHFGVYFLQLIDPNCKSSISSILNWVCHKKNMSRGAFCVGFFVGCQANLKITEHLFGLEVKKILNFGMNSLSLFHPSILSLMMAAMWEGCNWRHFNHYGHVWHREGYTSWKIWSWLTWTCRARTARLLATLVVNHGYTRPKSVRTRIFTEVVRTG